MPDAIRVLCGLVATALACAAEAETTCPQPLLTLDAAGHVLAGSHEALTSAALRGEHLRVGWSIGDAKSPHRIRHWTRPNFVTVFEGRVFGQIEPIHRQSPVVGQGRVIFPAAHQAWQASIGSDGRLVHRFVASDAAMAVQETFVAQQWCVDPSPPRACEMPMWRELYRNDADGRAVRGDKSHLLAAVRRGDPLRISWGARLGHEGRITVEHAADVVFTSIVESREVYVQVSEHVLQASYHDAAKARLGEPAVLWRALLGTDGRFDAVWVNRGTGDDAKRLPQRAAVAWHAFAPDPACDARPVPELAVPDGVRLDAAQPPAPASKAP